MGIVPGAVYGHSVGEVAAAYASGALTLEQACQVIYYRSNYQARTKGMGRMAAVNICAADALHLDQVQSGAVELGAVNSPESITLTGDEYALLQIEEKMQAQGIFFRLLDIDYPFHSRHMQSLQSGLCESLEHLRPTQAQIPFVSTVTGNELPGFKLGATYWWDNISQPVHFSAATQRLLDQGVRIFLEIGPHSILQYYINDDIRRKNISARSLPTLKRNAKGSVLLRQAWTQAYISGWTPAADCLFPTPQQRIDLPAYPWDRMHCAMEASPESQRFLSGQPQAHPLLGYQHKDALLWENELDTKSHPDLAHHALAGQPVFPAAGYVLTVLAAAFQLHHRPQQELENLAFVNFLFLSPDQPRMVRTIVDEDGSVTMSSRTAMAREAWRLHCTGRIAAKCGSKEPPAGWGGGRAPEFGPEVDVAGFYAWTRKIGMEYGPEYQVIKQAWADNDQIVTSLELDQGSLPAGLEWHPALLDGAFQSLLLLMKHRFGHQAAKLYLPTRISKVRVFKSDRITYAHTVLEKRSQRSVLASLTLMNAQGEVLAAFSGCRFIQVHVPERLRKKQGTYILHSLPLRHPHDLSAAKLPKQTEIQDRLEQVLSEDSDAFHRDVYYQDIVPLSQAALLFALYEHFCNLHWAPGGFSVDELMAQNAIQPHFKPYLVYALNLLAGNNMAYQEQGIWKMHQVTDQFSAPDLWQTIVSDYPAYLPEAVLLGRLSLHLSDIWKGRTGIDELLSVELNGAVENLYTNSLSSRLLISLLQKLLKLVFQDSYNLVRILEIGAGPGECMARIVPVLPENAFEYVAADKDEARVAYMRSNWEGHSGVNFTQLDIEKMPPELFADLGSFDLVLASHALHQTNDLDQALSNCRRLLRPGGMLVVSEFQPLPVLCCTLGLDPSFWDYSLASDQAAPRLQSDAWWAEALENALFEQVQTIQEANGRDQSDCFLLLARKSEHQEQSLGLEQKALDHNGRLWLVVEDEHPSTLAGFLAREIALGLARAGGRTVRIRAGEEFMWSPDNPQEINPFSLEQWEGFFSYWSGAGTSMEVVNLLGFAPEQEMSGAGFQSQVRLRTGAATVLSQAWDRIRLPLRVWLFSAGALHTSGFQSRPVPGQACEWGLGRVMLNELPGLDVRLVDIHADQPDQVGTADLLRELIYPDAAREVILADNKRYAPRLLPADQTTGRTALADGQNTALALRCAEPGSLEALYWEQSPISEPGPEEVQVEVMASGLNFRDVMYVLGYLPEDALDDGFSGPSLGLECSGRILKVGSNVQGIQVGDEVVVMSGTCLGTRVNVRQAAVFRKPNHWTHREAATMPVAFFTACYAMIHLARLRAGETILIHGGAGGVGLAAIQVANHLGVQVFASAGTREKRDFLRLKGVDRVFDSRTLNFEQEILEVTQGQGVDAVLNCLAGEALNKSLALLKPFGRFMELGKTDILANSALRMYLLRQNISFFSIDVDQMMNHRPGLARSIFEDIIDLCNQGVFSPLPHSVYQCAATGEAFRAMQKSKHIGKIVVQYDQWPGRIHSPAPTAGVLPVNSQGTYLITGGFGGLGLRLAWRLVHRGARHLILCARSGAESAEKRQALEELSSQGVQIHVLKADVADQTSVVHGLDQALAHMPPLKGVVHCAAQLHDALLTDQTLDTLQKALGPKALGAWNLHLYTQTMDLDFFILFSSATTLLGNPGQANYVAANAELETLAAYRRSQGLPGLSVAWGPVQDVGMLHRDPQLLHSLKKRTGMQELTSSQALDYLELLLGGVHPNWAVFGLDWSKVARLPIAKTSLFHLLPELRGKGLEGPTEEEMHEVLSRLSSEDGVNYLAEQIREELAMILRTSSPKIKLDVPLAEQGMDSLMGIELTLALEKRFDLDNQAAASLARNTTVHHMAAALQQQITQQGQGGRQQELIHVMHQHGFEVDPMQTEDLLAATEHLSVQSHTEL